LTIAGLSAPGGPRGRGFAAADRDAPSPRAASASSPTKPDFAGAHREPTPLTSVAPVDGVVKLHVSLKLPAGWKINPLGPMSYWLDSPRASGPADRGAFGRTKLGPPTDAFDVPVRVNGTGQDELTVSLNYFYCQTKDAGVCKVGAVVFTVPLNIAPGATSTSVRLVHNIPE
jgi:hypothetical protein